MYRSIEKARYDAVYTAFMSMDASLPSDMVLEVAFTEANKPSIIAQIEAVAAATGRDVMLVGSKVAISKLQSTINYNMWSGNMKDEKNNNGVLGMWEGYECLALSRVNATGTRTEISDNTKVMIIPVDPEFKPIKRVNEGDVQYYESGMDGMKKDMTVDGEIHYAEGIGVVVNQLFGVLKIDE